MDAFPDDFTASNIIEAEQKKIAEQLRELRAKVFTKAKTAENKCLVKVGLHREERAERNTKPIIAELQKRGFHAEVKWEGHQEEDCTLYISIFAPTKV